MQYLLYKSEVYSDFIGLYNHILHYSRENSALGNCEQSLLLLSTRKRLQHNDGLLLAVAKTVGFDAVSKEALLEVLVRNLIVNVNLVDEDDGYYENAADMAQELLKLDMNIYFAWLKYIDGLRGNSNKHHAFHGVKGAEFDRVIAIASNTYARNLLYVAPTRAREEFIFIY